MLNIRRFLNAIGIKPTSATAIDSMGEIEVLSSDGSLQYHDGTSVAKVTTASNTQTLTNKTLTAPVVNSPTGIVKGDVGLGNVDNTSDANKPVSTATQTALDLKANIASPTFTGTPTAPTATAGTNTTQIATTAYVDTADALKANLASPDFTGTPTVPTATVGTDTTQIASTAFVIANSVQSLTGDVTGTGPGATDTTVAKVGGSSANIVAAGALLANAATNANTASAIMKRDSSKNVIINHIIQALTTTETSEDTTTLTGASSPQQHFSGTTTQTVVLPAANALVIGHSFTVMNRSTGIITVNTDGGTLLSDVAPGSQTIFTVVSNLTSEGTWDIDSSILAVWGGISGSLDDQSDLSTALGLKAAITYVDDQIDTAQPLDSDLTAFSELTSNGLVTKTGDGTAEGRTLTGTSNEISITNGDGVSGNPTIAIASNPVIPGTDSITVPKGSTDDRGTGVEGKFRYNSDTAKFEGYTSSGWGSIAGSGGGTNFLTATDGSAIGTIVAYADAAQATPEDGQSGTPNSTIAVSTDSSLVGETNFLWTKSSSTSRQGEGWSQPFTIDEAYQSKMLTFTGLYRIDSGTYADGDMTFWIRDEINEKMIQPSAYKLMNVGGVGEIRCEFQAPYNSTSLRLIVHTASTSAEDYSIRFDALSVSPNTYSTGASITDWSSTPAPSGTITNATRSSYLARRVGGNLEVQATVLFSGAGSLTFSAASLLPAGLSVDTSRLSYVAASPNNANVGKAYSLDSGTADYDDHVNYSQTNNTFTVANQTNIPPFTPGNLDSSQLTFSVPILGWGTSQVLSSETATNVVAAIYNTSGSVTLTGGSPINFATLTQDTSGAVTVGASWKFTAPVPGFYQVYATLSTTSVSCGLDLYKNGSLFKRFGWINNTTYGGNGTSVYLNAGEYIDLRPGTNGTLATDNLQSISIFRLSGPAQIAASEKVKLFYRNTGATVYTANSTKLSYGTKVQDSHGAWDTDTFTAPRADTYTFRLTYYVTAATSGNVYLVVNENNVGYITGSASSTSKNGSISYPMNAKDTAYLLTDTGFTFGSLGAANWLSIESQG